MLNTVPQKQSMIQLHQCLHLQQEFAHAQNQKCDLKALLKVPRSNHQSCRATENLHQKGIKEEQTYDFTLKNRHFSTSQKIIRRPARQNRTKTPKIKAFSCFRCLEIVILRTREEELHRTHRGPYPPF